MNYIHEVLELRNMGVKPETAKYQRMAEGSALTRRHRRILKVSRWIARGIVYGGLIALLIWILT
jgi:hypothetical protein